ncbi:VOC family protein [Tessaracoccus caeni]|uniref:VOC family protein n=1 Tax=Tessaracoccus caeni TaxID=3031239 RepID=UPI0023D99C33|nr:VOC family protein [Tessaracoccus caeni]MDF1487261.1 VOC family protein [Tessaracoccus caeni]
MTISLDPYLNFAGNTREAMEFYQSIFGGELTISTFGEYGMGDDMPADGVMHAHLATSSFSLMASDAMPGAETTWGGTRNYLSVTGEAEDREKLTSWFEKLSSDGGSVGMPLAKQVWGDEFGICMDRYGLEWMISFPAG